MKDFVYRNKVIQFTRMIGGEVLGCTTHTDRYTFPNAPELNSERIVKHEFSIKSDVGTEEAIELDGVNMPLQSGQKVSLICACRIFLTELL